MPNLKINQSKEPPVCQQPIEIVERKGLGHPDTICDLLVEHISSQLSQTYIERFGRVLHYNLDKAMLAAGSSQPEFGGGKITSPMKLVLGDRATSRFGDQDIALDPLIERSVNDWFKQNLARVDPEHHLIVQNEIQSGSAELTGIFQREQVVANDTSAAVGYAPLSETERIVLDTERWLNSRETKQRFPVIGEDIKLMAVRNSSELSLTTAIAFVDQYVSSVQDYFEQKETITTEIKRHVESQLETIAAVNVQLNTLDDPQLGKAGIYLTVTGTSAECGDSGEVGRGNNVRGLISLNRPVSNEAAAGKNPVSHVGKIYNLLSYEIADRIHETVEGVEEVYVWLVSQIGRPISQPWLGSASVRLKSDVMLSDVDVAKLKQLSDRCKEHLLAIISDDLPLSKYRDTLSDPGFNIFYNANTLVVICAKPSGHHPAEDCNLAAQNLMLAAHDKGLVRLDARPWFQQPDGKRAINIGAEFDPVFPIIVGKQQGEVPPVAREKPEILHWA